MLNRFSPLEIKNLKLKNRVVVPPMASGTADTAGFVTDQTLEHYARLADSGASLLFVEYSYVDKSGRSEANQLAVDYDDKIPGLTKLAEVIKSRGLLAGLQITHAGGKTSEDLTEGPMWGPSSVAVPAYKEILRAPQEMPKSMINGFVQSFVSAAARAAAASFDVLEIHCAHGYGINQWLSPITNQRTDEYGGSLQNRAKILFAIVQRIKSRFPHLILATRIPGQDLLDGGLTIGDVQWLAQELEGLGVDLLDVSSGLGGWRRPKDRRGQGYLIPEAAEIQKVVSAPVIGVGGISEGEYIDDLIAQQTVSLTAVGRAILESPSNWKNQVMLASAN